MKLCFSLLSNFKQIFSAVIIILSVSMTISSDANEMSCSFENSTDLKGNDISQLQTDSKGSCCAICSNHPNCTHWTWGETVAIHTCFLKYSAAGKRVQKGAWSGTADTLSFQVASVFGSNMVLQKAPTKAKIWGMASIPGTIISIQFNNKIYNVTVDTLHHWVVSLDPTPAGGPYQIRITSANSLVVFENILVGDVFICSGQSNMEFQVSQAFNSSIEIARAKSYITKPIRIFQAGHSSADEPSYDFAKVNIPWSNVSSTNIGQFSAVCWFSGRDTLDQLLVASNDAVAIGLIETNVGGTGVEYWSPAKSIANCSQVTPSSKGPNPSDSTLWNGMVAPLTVGPLAIGGFLWYQGESNTCPQNNNRPCGEIYYSCQFTSMIESWRLSFNNPSLHFTFVLLAPDKKNNAVAAIRRGQITALDLPNTFAANAMDDGDCTPSYCSVHVRNKQLIGNRVANILLGSYYSRLKVAFLSPHAQNASCTQSKCKIYFHLKSVGSGLKLDFSSPQSVCNPYLGGTTLCKGFDVQTVDGIWHAVNASSHVSIASPNILIIALTNITNNIAKLQYAQSDWPLATLYSSSGIPSLPFSFNITYVEKKSS